MSVFQIALPVKTRKCWKGHWIALHSLTLQVLKWLQGSDVTWVCPASCSLCVLRAVADAQVPRAPCVTEQALQRPCWEQSGWVGGEGGIVQKWSLGGGFPLAGSQIFNATPQPIVLF